MNLRIKDELQLKRYHKLSDVKKKVVNEILTRHIRACRREKVEPELEATFREAIDMAIVGTWEPDRPLEIEGPRWQYDVYVSPSKEAA
jgi:hypothetical protein